MDQAALTDRIATTLMAEPAASPTPSSSETTSPGTSSQATQPSPTPESATTPPSTSTETPQPEDEEFSFPDEMPQQEETPVAAAEGNVQKPDDELGDLTGKLPKEVQEAFLKTSRGRRLYDGFRLAQAMLKPEEQGGLGRLPSVDEIREFHRDSQDLRLMAHEFHHGDPAYAQNWVRQWFQPGPNGYSEGARQVARNFVPVISEMAKQNPQAAEMYREIAVPAVMNYINEWYERAAEAPTKEERTIAYNVAMAMEQDLTGRTRNVTEEMLDPGYRAPNAVDPQRQEIDQKLRFINQFEQRQNQALSQQFQNAMAGAIHKNVTEDVNSALAKLEEVNGKFATDAMKRQMTQEVYNAVNANPTQLRNFVIARDQASRLKTPEAIQAAADAWRSVARPIVRQLRAKYMAESGQKLIARSAERHAVLEEASRKRGTNGVVQPPQKNLAAGPAQGRQPGESYEDYLQRVTAAAISA